MNKVINFPQCQHQQFRRLVFKSVLAAARDQDLRTEDYIARIYYAGENPGLFSSRSSLDSIYRRFRELIEDALRQDTEATGLSKASKAYLCFRIYLHSLCKERRQLPDDEAELYLQDALQEYFQAGKRRLSGEDESRIMHFLRTARRSAQPMPD